MSSEPLRGARVIEFCGEACAYAGKLFGDAGADVILIDPPGGHKTRTFAPFVNDQPHPDRSLHFWTNNTSKRSVTLDIDDPEGRESIRRLVAGADFVIESGAPGRLAALGLDYPDLNILNPKLIMVSITPYGRIAPRANEQATDLTLMAGGGIVWNAGYDDHLLPPVRGGGGQGFYAGCHFAVMSALVALLYRNTSADGTGQHIDVNLHAACNVTTEAGSYYYLTAKQTVQRQTGRHVAGPRIARGGAAADRWRYHEWLTTIGLVSEFSGSAANNLAPRAGVASAKIHVFHACRGGHDVDAAREGLAFIASRLEGYVFFIGAQDRGFQCGIIYTPDEALCDPHFAARGFPVPVEHPELGRTITYPGAPYRMTGSPVRINRRPPLVGEHTEEVLAEIAHARHTPTRN